MAVGRLLGLCAVAAALLAQQQPLELQILVIGGEGSINNVKQRTAREPIVEVRDRNNRPVAGAAVLFEAPRTGASGAFTGGSTSLRVTTDAQGRAVGQGFRPNASHGNFQIQVSATVAGSAASTVIHMQNVGPVGIGKVAKFGGHGKLIAIIAGAGAAAAAGGAYAATHSGSGATPAASVPTTIAAGTGTVGGRP